jgi:hypothetical protein
MTTLEINDERNNTNARLKSAGSKFTEDDLRYVGGKHQELLGQILKRICGTRAAIEKAILELHSS